jgi:hypothetical protein
MCSTLCSWSFNLVWVVTTARIIIHILINSFYQIIALFLIITFSSSFINIFFLVKDKGMRKFLRGRSQGGLYPLQFSWASPPSTHHASSSIRIKSFQWHQHISHPSNNGVSSIVRNNGLLCLSWDNTALVCDACQCAKIHQLPYHLSSHVSTMRLELIHSDVWGQFVLLPGVQVLCELYQWLVTFLLDLTS